MKILFACSTGGHLAQLAQLETWWGSHDRRWIVLDREDTRSLLADELVIEPFHPTTRNLPNAIRNFGLARRVLKSYRPDVIVSTGAAVAVPVFLAGRLFGIPCVYIEGFGRISEISLTGRLSRPLVQLFLVQWPEQHELVTGSRYIGPIYPWAASPSKLSHATTPKTAAQPEGVRREPTVLVTLGTDHHPFDRVVDWIERWASQNPDVHVVVQHGESRAPFGTESHKHLPHNTLTELIGNATAVVTHAGGGSVSHCWRLGRAPIAVPRLAQLGEHVDDHQQEFSRRLEELSYPAEFVRTYDELQAALASALVRGPSLLEAHGQAESPALDSIAALVTDLVDKAPRPKRFARRRRGDPLLSHASSATDRSRE